MKVLPNDQQWQVPGRHLVTCESLGRAILWPIAALLSLKAQTDKWFHSTCVSPFNYNHCCSWPGLTHSGQRHEELSSSAGVVFTAGFSSHPTSHLDNTVIKHSANTS